MDLHPILNDPVVLRDQAEREYVSRVENLGVNLLVVARPHDLPAEESVDTGTDLEVVWADSDGVVRVLPTRFMGGQSDGTRELWSLFVTGPTTTAQRRRHVRVPAAGPVALRSASSDELDPVVGNLVDVSEGGVRCSVEVGAGDRFLTGSSAAIAEFRLGDVDFELPGRVEFLRASDRPAELEQLVVVLDEPVANLDALRAQILALQVQASEVEGAAES